jgi:hypothetical protein
MTEVIALPRDRGGHLPGTPGLFSETAEAMLTRLSECEGQEFVDEFKAIADDGMLKLVVNLHYLLDDMATRLARMERFFKGTGVVFEDSSGYTAHYSLSSDPHRRHWPCWTPGKEADMLCHCHDGTGCACNGLPPHPRGTGLDACGDRP